MAADARDTLAFAVNFAARCLASEVERMRAAGVPVAQDDYRGLYIPDTEADRLVKSLEGEGEALQVVEGWQTALAPAPGNLGRLFVLAALSPFEAACVTLCLAAEADPRLERLVAYVQDDVTRKRPRVEMALRLFGAGSAECLQAFEATAPLRRHRLIALSDDAGQAVTPLTAQQLSLEPRVFAFLSGMDSPDEALLAAIETPALSGVEQFLPPELAARCQALGESLRESQVGAVLAVSGDDADLVWAAVGRVAAAAGLGVLAVSAPGLKAVEGGLGAAIPVAVREAGFRSACLLVTRLDDLDGADQGVLFRQLGGPSLAPLVALASATPAHWPGIHLAVPQLDFEGRLAFWRRELEARGAQIPGDELASLSGKFRLPARAIVDAAAHAEGLARSRDPGAAVVLLDDLYVAVRAQSTPVLSSLARKVTPHYRWSDIVVTPDTSEQLHEICGQVEHRHLVYDEWGFDRKLATSKGVMALFTGQPGTGKTMAADVIANALGLDLYRIDLSGVVSKYIGETEKNLSTIFTQAERSNAVLFFDEADALFGKRSEVKDAHDRYANIETAYLLQQMEEYRGVVILATNLRNNLDEAFLRRLHFVIEFPMPDEGQRRRIWQETLPPELPRETVDFDFLARTFKVAGGNIRNAVLAGAFLAAGEGVAPGMAHLIRGMRREYQKIGRMITEAEFGPYFALFRGD